MTKLSTEEISFNFENIERGAISQEKLLSSQSGNMGAHSRITFRRVTKTSRSITTGEQITLVHSTSVATSRSWSGPRIERPAINSDGHTVFGLDLLDAIPTSSDLFGWVNNLDAFIKDQNIGLEKSEVDADTAASTDQRSNDYFNDTTVKRSKSSQSPRRYRDETFRS
jgi:hypothetical protein